LLNDARIANVVDSMFLGHSCDRNGDT
jgi:hypothetical protein